MIVSRSLGKSAYTAFQPCTILRIGWNNKTDSAVVVQHRGYIADAATVDEAIEMLYEIIPPRSQLVGAIESQGVNP